MIERLKGAMPPWLRPIVERCRSLAEEPTLGACLFIALAGSAIGWGLAAEAVIKSGGYPLGPWPMDWRYADSGLPMIHTADGFFFIHWAKEALENGFGALMPDGRGGLMALPAFSLITAFLSKFMGTPVENVAFQMSFFTHLGLGVIAAFWARAAKLGRLGLFLLCLLVPLVPGWLERGGPGQYDTDLAINLLLQLSLFWLVKAALGLRESNRPVAYALAAALAFIVLLWIWRRGTIGLSIAAFALWLMFFLPLRVVGLKLRVGVAVALALWLGFVMLFPEMGLAPEAVTSFFQSQVARTLGFNSVNATTGLEAYAIHSNLFAQSIQEQASVPMSMILERLGGNVLAGAFMLAAAALAVVKSPALRFPVLYSLIWIVLGTKTLRLMYLGTFPVCVAFCAMPRLAAEALARFPQVPIKPWLTRAVGSLLVALVILSCANMRFSRRMEVRWTRQNDATLEPLRRETEGLAGFSMFNWWDDGHFLSARLGARAHVFYNGGVPSAITGYALGHALTMENHDLAAKWMRFFAVHGNDGILPAVKVWGDAAWDNLEKALAGEDVPGLGELENWREWLFPKDKVYWYVPGYFFSISSWWVPLGLSRDPDANLVKPHVEKIRRDAFVYDAKTGGLTVDMSLYNRGYKDFGLVINTSETPLAAPWPTAKEPYIAYSGKNGYAYITDNIGLRTLPLYMLAPGGPTPKKFREVLLDPTWGGIWEVLE